MLAISCPDVRTRTGRVLVPEEHVVGMTSDGSGTIVLQVRCWNGHVHELVTGRVGGRSAAA